MPRRPPKDIVLTRTRERGALGGQLPTVQGEQDILSHRIVLALASTPGELTHRPDYGAGVERFIGFGASPPNLLNLATAARAAALRVPDVMEAQVSTGAQADGAIVLRMSVTRRSAPTPDLLAFTIDAVEAP